MVGVAWSVPARGRATWRAGFTGIEPAVELQAVAAPHRVRGRQQGRAVLCGRQGRRQGRRGWTRDKRARVSHRDESPFFNGPLRAPEQLQNTFAHESFLDEVASR